MNSSDIVGWVSPEGFALCTDHGSDERDLLPIFADSAWDSFPSCDVCHEVIDDVQLTEYGLKQQWLNKHNKKMRKVLDENNGEFPYLAWPGGYPFFYVDEDSNALCPKCGNDQDSSTVVVAYDVNWEDETLYCDDCSEQIHSAYGDDNDEKE